MVHSPLVTRPKKPLNLLIQMYLMDFSLGPMIDSTEKPLSVALSVNKGTTLK